MSRIPLPEEFNFNSGFSIDWSEPYLLDGNKTRKALKDEAKIDIIENKRRIKQTLVFAKDTQVSIKQDERGNLLEYRPEAGLIRTDPF